MFVLGRALAYAATFIGLVLVLVPARLLAWSGMATPTAIGTPQVAGMVAAAVGGALALWCVFELALVGHGTPAPFDASRRLVVRGPYAVVRNPMYLGAVLALAGAALFYRSAVLASYAVSFLLLAHAFVLLYEEPTLRTRFGAEYDAYRRQVPRWWPRLHAAQQQHAAAGAARRR
jgi:protein-S-isoprenylcysteine O-methyltransferase Ste14